MNTSAAQALSLTRFLVNDWGFSPEKIFITDDVPEIYQERIVKELRDLDYSAADDFEVVFTNDGGLCDEVLKKETFQFRKICHFGTAWDQLTAKNKQFPFVRISAPYGDSAVINKNYFAWDGALNFVRDLHDDLSVKILGSGVVVNIKETGGH